MHRLLTTGILITLGMLIFNSISGCAEDDPPEKIIQSPRATKVEVDPAPPSEVDEDRTEFILRFNQGVVAVTVNGTAATSSGQHWSVWSYQLPLKQGLQHLDIKWKNRDGSTGSQSVGPYDVRHGHGEPAVITGGTVADGDTDVDPHLLNAGGIEITFDEDVAGSIKLTDEVGADLNWIARVEGSKATLIPVAGQEAINETTYKIEINVRDGAGNRTQVTITFVTKPK